MWEAQAQMERSTGKLTHPLDYRPKAVIEKEEREKERAMKASVRAELLGQTAVSADIDFRLYSDSLAGKAQESKSEVQKREEAQRAAAESRDRQAEQLAKLKAIQQ